jgi:predicted MFS family arabinose efflux permease
MVSVVRGFVIIAVMLFLPGVLLTTLQKFGCDQAASMLIIGGLYALLALLHIAVTLPCSWIVTKVGVKGAFLFSVLLLLLFILLVFEAETLEELVMGFVVWGISAGIWWYTYHTFFLEVGDRDKVGRETSIFMLLQIGVSLIAPLVIGVLLSTFSGLMIGHFLIAVSCIALVLALFIRDFERLPVAKAREVVSDIRNHPRRMCSYMAMGGDSALAGFVWPLFLTMVLQNPLSLGIFAGMVTAVTAIATIWSGSLADKIQKTKLEHLGGTIIAVSWMIRALFITTPVLFVADIIYRIFHSFFVIPMDAYTYELGMQSNKARVVSMREIGVMFGYLVTVILFMIVVMARLPIHFVFLFGAILGMSTWLLKSPNRMADDPRLKISHVYR